ncbi:hypothetical protein T06_4674 [Trichinella sp. T6]|nr:hypothetical protein T06_4674 [Trichinella sp. T6]
MFHLVNIGKIQDKASEIGFKIKKDPMRNFTLHTPYRSSKSVFGIETEKNLLNILMSNHRKVVDNISAFLILQNLQKEYLFRENQCSEMGLLCRDLNITKFHLPCYIY